MATTPDRSRLTEAELESIYYSQPFELSTLAFARQEAKFAGSAFRDPFALAECPAEDLAPEGRAYFVKHPLKISALRDLVEELTGAYEAHRILVAGSVHAAPNADDVSGEGGSNAWTALAGTQSVFVQLNAIRAAFVKHKADAAAHTVADTATTPAVCVVNDVMSAIRLANELLDALNTHMADTDVHGAADATNPVSRALYLDATTGVDATVEWLAFLWWDEDATTETYSEANHHTLTLRHGSIAESVGTGRFRVASVNPALMLEGTDVSELAADLASLTLVAQVLTVPTAAGNLATLDALGALDDSGVAAVNVQVLTVPAAAGNLASLDALGALDDSGIAAADVQVLTVPAVAGNLASLTALGALDDSGVAAADVQVLTVPAVAASIATLDAAGALDDSGIVVTGGAIDGADVTAGAASDVDTLHGEVLTALAPTLPAQHAVVTHAAAPAGVAVGCGASSGSCVMLTALAVDDLVPIWEGGAAAAGIFVPPYGAGQPVYVSPAGALYADMRGFGFAAGAVGYVLSASGRALPVTCAADPTDGGANAAVHIEGVASAFEADLSGFPGAPANVDVPLSTTHRQSLALATITA
jgi:hypothetical protein